ncbi:MAG: hypothetical protein GKR99_10675 [Rhodobacteraceae bacterium]|nr:hypothetical protein [Paracoccaceae bacterium]
MRLVYRFLLCLGLATMVSSPASARENHALLIGVSTYDNLEKKYWLRGPANDIALVETYLTSQSPVSFDQGNVRVLADGVEGAERPTLAAIRAAFADLAATVQADDFIYLHFSGHGSQAPAIDPSSELDGLDELFLPIDVGPWSNQTGSVDRALVDDEIGQMIGALRAKGATVWAVFDSCHSGTVTRAAPTGADEVRLRKLGAEALHIPETAKDAVTTRALPDARSQPASPIDLTEGAGITYAQLGQEMLRKYTVLNRAQTTPMFEGDLQSRVFGGDAVPRVAQWPLSMADGYVSIPAGRLHGLVEGAELAVVASPADATGDALGRVTVDFVDTFVTEAVVAEDGALALGDVPRGAYLRKLSEDVDFSLNVALPEAGSEIAARMQSVADALRGAPDGPARVTFVAAGAEADIRLAILPDSPRPDAIWFLPASGLADEGALEQIISVSTDDKTDAELGVVIADTLARMSKALNLLKLGAAFGGSDLDVTAALLRTDQRQRRFTELDPAQVPRLVPDDVLYLKATNNLGQPVDVNVLYVGSDYSISHILAIRMTPGDELNEPLVAIDGRAYGRDRVIVVMSPAKRGTATEDLSFLEQASIPTLRDIDGGDASFSDLVAEAGFGTTTRSATSVARDTGPKPGILQFEIDAVRAE